MPKICTYSVCTVGCVWRYAYTCETVTTIKILNISITSKSFLLPLPFLLFLLVCWFFCGKNIEHGIYRLNKILNCTTPCCQPQVARCTAGL